MKRAIGCGGPVPRARSNRTPHIYAIVPAIMPSALILILKPFFELERRGEITFDFALGSRWKKEALLGSDIVSILRGNTLSDLRALRLAERHAIPVVYDIDDNFHEIPLASELGRSLRASRSIAVVDRFFRSAETVRVYGSLMEDVAASRGANVSLEHLYFDPPEDLQQTVDMHPEDGERQPIRLVYASARQASEAEEEPMMAALANIARRHGDAVEIVLWKRSPLLLSLGARARIEAPVADYTGFLRRLAGLRPAIGLAPLGPNRFFQSKTANKYREYGGLGIPAVYSMGALYDACVRHGETGLLVDNTRDSWEAAIELLLRDGALRRRLADAALGDVRQNYSYEAFLRSWRRTIHNLTSRGCTRSERRPDDRVPVVTLVGREWRRSSVAPVLLNLVVALGGTVRKKKTPSGLGSDDAFIYAPGPDAEPWQPPDGAWGIVDLTLAGVSAKYWPAGRGTRLVALRGTPAAAVKDILNVPEPTAPEGRYDAGGAEAMLLPLAEALLDRAPQVALRLRERVWRDMWYAAASPHAAWSLAMRLRLRISESGDNANSGSLARIAEAAKQTMASLRLRWNQRRYERRLRATRKV